VAHPQPQPQPREMSGRRERATRLAMKWAGAAHRWLYRATGGKIGRSVSGLPVLLLTTTGRRTGRPRTWPLGYLEDGDDLVIIASAGGVSAHPAWYLNLRDHPEVTVRIGDQVRQMRAETAQGEERARLWAKAVARYAGFAQYQKTTRREIPVVVLRSRRP
jgi:F420H(2)-dependent quinone reductase